MFIIFIMWNFVRYICPFSIRNASVSNFSVCSVFCSVKCLFLADTVIVSVEKEALTWSRGRQGLDWHQWRSLDISTENSGTAVPQSTFLNIFEYLQNRNSFKANMIKMYWWCKFTLLQTSNILLQTRFSMKTTFSTWHTWMKVIHFHRLLLEANKR